VPQEGMPRGIKVCEGVLHTDIGTVTGCCGHVETAAYWGVGVEGKRYVF
jgi:hypothetical protein